MVKQLLRCTVLKLHSELYVVLAIMAVLFIVTGSSLFAIFLYFFIVVSGILTVACIIAVSMTLEDICR